MPPWRNGIRKGLKILGSKDRESSSLSGGIGFNWKFYFNCKGFLKMRNSILVLVLFTLTSCGINTSPGNGEKIGQIVRARKTGIFCKTWGSRIN